MRAWRKLCLPAPMAASYSSVGRALRQDADQQVGKIQCLHAQIEQAYDAFPALLVCRVDSTRWSVREAPITILAVSVSRISPIVMTSGSARKNPRTSLAKVRSIFELTCTWRRSGWLI